MDENQKLENLGKSNTEKFLTEFEGFVSNGQIDIIKVEEEQRIDGIIVYKFYCRLAG